MLRLPSFIVPTALFPGSAALASFQRGDVVSGRGGWTLVSLDAMMSERHQQLWHSWFTHIDQSRRGQWKTAPAELHYFVVEGTTGLCFHTPVSALQRTLLLACSCIA